jgi:hypothetical protein
MRLLCDCCAIAMRLLCDCCDITMRLPCDCYAIAMRLPSDCYAIAMIPGGESFRCDEGAHALRPLLEAWGSPASDIGAAGGQAAGAADGGADGPAEVKRGRLLQLLEFCTALKVLPQRDHPRSLAKQPIRVILVPPDEPNGYARAGALPTASTCARELYLPRYPDEASLRERFEYALDHMQSSGFMYE